MTKEHFEQSPRINSEGEIALKRRTLWLTDNPDLVRQQIEGENFTSFPQDQLARNVSTDEIIPSRWVFYFDEQTLGEHCLTGFRGGVIKPGDIRRGQFDLIVSGPSFGSGSSREHAPISIKGAGVKAVAATPIERIFLQNSNNINLSAIEDPQKLNDFLKSKKVSKETLSQDYDQVSKDVVRFGGLLNYLQARLDGRVAVPDVDTGSRPMTMVEKIMASHWVNPDGSNGRVAVKPGDTGFIKADFRYSYEIMSPISITSLQKEFNNSFNIANPDSLVLFADHTALLEPQNRDQAKQVAELTRIQRAFAREHGIKLYPPDTGICHNVVVENHALPGQVVLGTDSHTCSVGSVGALADGIGSTEMAGAWITGDTRVTVPETWRYSFKGKLPEGSMAKDVMLSILSTNEVRNGSAVRKVFEYGGDGLQSWSFDELFVLANMSAEIGAFTGIVEPTDAIAKHLLKTRSIPPQGLKSLYLKSDENAEFERAFEINLDNIKPMVALPGDPRKGAALEDLVGEPVDAAYIGSCTGGKLEDLIAAAQVLDGKKVKVPTYAQASSLSILNQARKLGVVDILQNAGVNLIGPGCGDCCNLGFGVVEEGGTIASDTNRNFPRRMGDNNVYLLNPRFTAMAALNGRLSI